MNIKFLIIPVLLGVLTLSAYAQTETASVAIGVTVTSPSEGATIKVGESATFQAQATGGTGFYSYAWDFADGSNAAGASFAKTYSTAGSYHVTVTVADTTGAQAADSVNITVAAVDNGGGGSGSTKPVISNIHVTDVTETSAIVRWTTDKSANSRVIYDATSHSSITGASFPNFGYANSSAPQDDSTKVTDHAVTITGLTANTTYYFRVLSQ